MKPRARVLTMADAILPKATLLRNILLVLSFSGMIAISARLSLTVPWSPVPITGQTFAVLLTGALLGSRLGAMSIWPTWLREQWDSPYLPMASAALPSSQGLPADS